MARILIVEDDKPSAEAMALMLRHSGHDVELAPSGHEALGAVMEQTPDLVMLDLGIPGADGAAVLEVLRSYLRLQSLPVVIWTGMADSELADRARELGAAAVIEKGSQTPAQILATINGALSQDVQ